MPVKAPRQTGDSLMAAAVDDIANDATTTAALAVGASINGTIDFTNDSDWYRVEVSVGRTYIYSTLKAKTREPARLPIHT